MPMGNSGSGLEGKFWDPPQLAQPQAACLTPDSIAVRTL